MESPTVLDDTCQVTGEETRPCALVRKPLRRSSANEYFHPDARSKPNKNGPFSKRSLSQSAADSRASSPGRSLDDLDSGQYIWSGDGIHLNPLTTYRRAPRSVHSPVSPPVCKPKPKPRTRPTLDLSVISNLTPVGQLVTFRRIPVVPDRNGGPNNNGVLACDNPTYEHGTILPSKVQRTPTRVNPTSDSDHNKLSENTSVTSVSSVKQNNSHDAHIVCTKTGSTNNKRNSRTDRNTKLPSKRTSFKEHLNGIVSKWTNTNSVAVIPSEQLDDTVNNDPDDSNDTTDSVDKGTRYGDSYLYCRIITQFPKTSFLITFAGHFLIAMTTIGLLLSGYDLFPTDFETLPMSDWNVPWKTRDLAWRFRNEYENRYVRKWYIENQHKWYRSKDYGRANIVLYYDTVNGNIFEKENLLNMKEIEDRIFSIKEYGQYCVQTTAMTCQKPTSLLRLFDGTFSLLDSRFLDPGFDNIAQVLHTANTNNFTKSKFAFFLSKDAVISPTLAFSPITRTVIPMGYPLQMGEHSESMENKMEKFLVKYFKPIIEETKQNTSRFNVIYWSYLLFLHDIVVQIMYDAMFAGGSAMFIFVFIVYHTKSLWISTLSVFSILTSFLATNILYRVVLEYKYFGFFHVIALFIILGIGADDLFVFIDVWKSTEFKEYRDLAHRLSDAYRKSVLSMFFTSLTTAVAFFANAFSPLLAPQSFGVFAGLLVIVNYISVIVYFPTVIIMQHLYFKSWKWPCFAFMSQECQLFRDKDHKKVTGLTEPGNFANTDLKPEVVKTESLFADNTSRSSTGHLYNVVGTLNTGFTPDQHDDYGFFGIQRNTSQSVLITPQSENEAFTFPIDVDTDSSMQRKRNDDILINSKNKRATPLTNANNNTGSIINRTDEIFDMSRKSSEATSLTPQKNNEVVLIPPSSKTSIVLSAINNFDEDAVDTQSEHIELSDESQTGASTSPKEDNYDVLSETKTKKALVVFFRDYYFRFVTHWLLKWIIVTVLMGNVAFFAYCVTKLETENEQVQLYRKSHNYGRALDLDFHYFVANEADRNVKVNIVWGLKPRDMSVCHFSDSRCEGREAYDDKFDPNTPEAQTALKKFCNRLHSFTADEIEYFSIRRHFVSNVPEIRCFTDELDGYLREESTVTGLNLSLPWDYERMMEFMKSKSDLYNTARFDNSFTDVLQIPISYWLNDGYKYRNKNKFDEYHSMIGESIGRYSTPLKSDMSVFVGNKIRYIGAEVNLTLGTFTSGYPVGKPAMDRWEKFVQDQMKEMPKGLQNGFQLTRTFWHSVSVQKTMADNAILGIVIGILFAFPILTVATQNLVIAFFAIFSMCCSTVCVVGVIPLVGWKLGILESLNMCMVVGLTVDYVVHLAESYHMSAHTDRKSRVRDMLELMGISVFSGACTSLGASLFMVFAQIQFIIRFGIFMFCTIGFSLLYSLGLFTTLMGIFGPSGQTGDVKYLYNKLKATIRCKGTIPKR